MGEDLVIHCIGDSHASFFSGYDLIQPAYPERTNGRFSFLKAYRLGAVLAYSLKSLNTKEKGREKLLDLVSTLPKGATIMMCFGEIDCRCHLVKQAEIAGLGMEIVVRTCVERYFEVVDELSAMGFRMMLWNVVPTAESFNAEYPTYGAEVERNQCTRYFNAELSRLCKERGLLFVSVFDRLLDSRNQTRSFYFFDSIHLGQLAMPYFLKEAFRLGLIREDDLDANTGIRWRVALFLGASKFYIRRFLKGLLGRK